MADPISTLPPAPSRADPINFSDEADALLGALDGFVTETNAVAVAMNLNDTNDVSTSSVAIGLGAKTFTVTAAKSFLPGMFLSIADDAAPSTNSMFGQITSYSGTTLIMNITFFYGSGTKSAWTISQAVPFGATGGAISLLEQASAIASVAGEGQVWVKDDDPNSLYFTGDTGVDHLISNKPSFLVTNSVEQSFNVGVSTVVFGTEITDIGDNFTANTFTAPVGGMYNFNVNIAIEDADAAAAFYIIELVTSNATFRLQELFPPVSMAVDGVINLSGGITVPMDTNNTAYMTITQDQGASQSKVRFDVTKVTYFSGFLI